MDKRIHINGFTMIEMIFVLLLLVLLSGLSTLIHQPKKQKDDMIIQISQVFDHARLHSVTHKEKITISVTSRSCG
ncbi:MAG: prepilin-type N-terminal cleavage/methylation domain-containing protein [bacterium]